MKNEVYRLLALAAACNLSNDAAYNTLNEDFIGTFAEMYESDLRPDKPTVVDAYITYVMQELQIQFNVNASVVYELRSRREGVVDLFVRGDIGEMTTMLAGRSMIREAIREHLKRENIINNMYSKVNSSRINVVVTQFLEMFRRSCSHAYQFRGTFPKFVMNCFINFFYKLHSRDIWNYLRETDLEKREVDSAIVQEREVTTQKFDDFPIHDLLLNISLLNNLLFRHSGQSEESHGIKYDIYYLMLCELCRAKVKKINEKLGRDLLEFVDPYDRKSNRYGMTANKGISAKIVNATELVPYIFDYVRKGKLNIGNIAELRDTCFQLGRHDREGRNCIWKDVCVNGETSRYLDGVDARINFSNFDILLKGAISVYTLMSEFEGRGMWLVDSYDRDLFLDHNIIRYMDYLSGLQYVPLIRQLQAEPVDMSRYSKELLEFDEMVDAHAGSEDNKGPEIRYNRYYAITHGFMVNPRIKQSDAPTCRFDVLNQIAGILDSTPRGYDEYMFGKDSYERKDLFSENVELEPKDVVNGQYCRLQFNSIVLKDVDKAEYYLQVKQEDYVTLTWSLGLARYEAMEFEQLYGIYVPLEGVFLFYNDENQIFTDTLEEARNEYLRSFANNRATLQISLFLDMPDWKGPYANDRVPLMEALKLPWHIGLCNLGFPEITEKSASWKVESKFRKHLVEYQRWVAECAEISASFIEVARTIWTEIMFLTCGNINVIPMDRVDEVKVAGKIKTSILSGEYDEETLNWVLGKFIDKKYLETVDVAQGVAFKFRPINTLVVQYLYGDDTTLDQLGCKDLADLLKPVESPAERFIMMYNFLYTRLDFLRTLRDAYSLIVNTAQMDISTLACELNQRFGVDTILQGFSSGPVSYGIRLTRQDRVVVKSKLVEMKEECVYHFQVLTDELLDYLREGKETLAKLVDYNIVAQDVISSRFTHLGQAFDVLPAYTGIPELDNLRRLAIVDEAGFFLLNGTYFKIPCEGRRSYYVHRSGRMVREVASGLEPVDFNVETESGRAHYGNLIMLGLSNRGQ